MIIDLEGYDREGSFVAKERKKPIFFSVNALDEKITTYKIPEGFYVSYAPENFDLDIDFFNAKREMSHEGGLITVKDVSRYLRTQLPKEAYAKIKDFFDKLSSKTKQRIVLKKKEDK